VPECWMSTRDIVLLLVVLVIIGALPSWPYSRGWGWGPSGIVGLLLVVLLILAVMGRLG
jgi:peptidoglycan/LPS O-acetylase OafA/YrhL